ncbi:hypothetical protein QJ857_gp1017 [Tupanvirus soda lake]|uniref:U-box domain-containing protein n=2 Tax=Tupanvirus TaxID=2094720 RepID=A0A6N1NQZ1_9VIRU|nr:hypothetical protein QJ857_gp1017 [Tupanvirus soda lake]QKU35037.1 hypothetical protein [Tupanvirus soda lake]
MERKERYAKFVKYFRDSIICPINKTILLDPVLACDGIIYERDSIETWLKTSSISPTTGEYMNDMLVPCVPLRNIISQFLELNPNLKKEQHQTCLDHIHNAKKIKTFMDKYNFDKLLEYKNFSLKLLFDDKQIRNFLENASIRVQKYFIDNCNDLQYVDSDGGKLIHSAACYASLEIIKYLVDKGIDIDCVETSTGKKPIHYICKYRNDDIVKYFSSLNIPLEVEDNNGNHPIHYLCKNANVTNKTVIEFIEKGINLECSNKKGMYPLHQVCRYINESIELLYFLLDQNINLECTNCQGWKPIHYLCQGSNISIIKDIIDRGVDVESPTLTGEKPIHLLAKPETLTMVEYLIRKNVEVSNLITIEINNDNDNDNNDNNENNDPLT